MSTEWKVQVNAQYQRVSNSITGLATAALVLPLIFLRELHPSESSAPLVSYLTWPAYIAWGLLLSSILASLVFQYVSAKWVKSSAGAATRLSAKALEIILDISFWTIAITFMLGIGLLTYFAATLSGDGTDIWLAPGHAAAATSAQLPSFSGTESELSLLKQIADNTKSPSGVWVAAITATAAVLGALVSAWAGFLGMSKSAKSQGQIERAKLQASLVTNERLRWLQDLRSKMASFFTHVELQIDLLSRPYGDEGKEKYQRSLDEMSKQVTADGNAILLMLDSEKNEQRELVVAISKWLSYMNMQFSSRGDGPVARNMVHCSAMKTAAFDALRVIGQKAWKKVQSLE